MKHRELLLFLLFSHSVVSDSLRPHGMHPAKLPCPWGFPDRSIGVACHVLPQGIFPAQGLNPHLLQVSSIANGFFYQWALVTYQKATQTKQGLKPRHVHPFIDNCWSTAMCRACAKGREQSRKTTASSHRDFPGRSVVRSQRCHCWDRGSIPAWGTKILQVTGPETNKKTNKNPCMILLHGTYGGWRESAVI